MRHTLILRQGKMVPGAVVLVRPLPHARHNGGGQRPHEALVRRDCARDARGDLARIAEVLVRRGRMALQERADVRVEQCRWCVQNAAAAGVVDVVASTEQRMN